MPDTSVNFSVDHDYPQSDNISSSAGSKSLLIAHRENSINISPKNENLDKGFFDFGVVENGTIHRKTLEIINNTSDYQVYKIKRDPDSRQEDNFMEVTSTSAVVGPGCYFAFELRYSPQIPFTINIDYFNIFDSEGICLKFFAKGETRGPSLTTSGQKLTFISSLERKQPKRRVVEFTNDSPIVAQFIIDVDVRNSVFKPDPLLGYVKPNGSAYLGITFDPPGPGIYAKDLVCLVHHQSPIIIKLEGVCTSRDTKLMWRELNIAPIPQPYRIKHGFDWYFSHERCDADSQLALNIRSWNIDFGATVAGSEDLPIRFSVQNSSKKDVLLKWCKDPNKVFVITPEEQVIDVASTCVFEVRFRPTELDTLYSSELNGYGFWYYVPVDKIDFKKNQQVKLPIDVAVKLMGHTFPEGRNGLIPQITISPNVVTLPPCVPPLFSYSTFVIKRFGILPVMFNFLPPPNSNFSVRPKQGLIDGEFQLIVVKLSPGNCEGVFEEQWLVRLNGMPQFEDKVTFRGFAELPALKTNTNPVNVIHFPPTHPECVGYVDVPIHNLTRHCIRYRFCSTEALTRVTMEGGDTFISPNEVVVQTWSFVPHEPGVRELEVTLEAVALQDGIFPISTPVETPIMTYQHSQLAHLVGFPRVLDFGPSLMEALKYGKFRLYNFGVCPIHYELTCSQRGICIEDCVNNVDLLERWETVSPSSYVEVNVELRPSERGLQEFIVLYQVRESAFSNELVDDAPREVVRINYEGTLPKIKVVDLKYHCLGRTCPKNWLWHNLYIASLNTLLATSMPNTSYSIQMTPPTAALDSSTLNIFLYVTNNGEWDSEWSFKREQLCDCQRVQRSRGLSFRESIYECPHRNLFTVEAPLSGKLKVGANVTWVFHVQYTMEGTHELCYKLELSNNRKIFIFMLVTVLPKDEVHLGMVLPSLECQNIYIGDLHSILFMFWLYNNCLDDADYEVYTTQMKSANDIPINFNLFECMNPKAVVKSFTVHPIFFKFDPHQLQAYEIILPVRLGSKAMEIRVYCNGAVSSLLYTRRQDLPIGGIVHAPGVPLTFSIDHIVIIRPIPTHSKLERIFFFTNQSAHQYSYEWLELRLQDIVCATVSPAKGLLQPFQTQICKMTITTGGYPAMVNASFCVETMNLTEKRNYENSLLAVREANRQQEGEFIISAQGMTEPPTRTTEFPKPVSWQFTINLKSHVIGPDDIDTKVPLRDQLKYAPGCELDLSEKPIAPTLTTLEAEKITDELEKILWDSMSSKWMQEIILSLASDDHIYYSQFFMTRKQEAHMREKMVSIPSRRLVKILINDTIYQALQEYFGFAAVADDSDTNTARRGSSRKINSPDTIRRSELDLNQRVGSKLRVGSDLGLRIRIPDAW